jgi:hypothetical protein
MPYDNLIQRGDVAAFTTDTPKGRGKTPTAASRKIKIKPETPIPRPARGGKRRPKT